MNLIVLPTARLVSQHTKELLCHDGAIEHSITLGDFWDKSIIIPNRKKIDEVSRILLLKEATNFNDFLKLGFTKEFISFIKNHEFILKFFKELYSEDVQIEDISLKDFDAQWVEHIDILDTLYQKYIKLLDSRGYYDTFYHPNFTYNHNYLKRFDAIEIKIIGYITNKELSTLQTIAQTHQTYITLTLNSFNQKLMDKFDFIQQKDSGEYYIDLSQKKLVRFIPHKSKNQKIIQKSFATRVEQVGYIFKSIDGFINNHGINPQDIAIVLPDESFASTLRLFDIHRNLNYAMGDKLSSSEFYKSLEAICLYFSEQSLQTIQRVKQLSVHEIADKYKDIANSKDFQQFINLYKN